MNEVMNYVPVDPLKEPLFLGKSLGLQRYDILKYPNFFKLAKAQEDQFWRASEFSLLKDRGDFKGLTDTEQFVFTKNLEYQCLGDSCLSRSIESLKPYVSNVELEACFNAWSFFECNIHSRSYQDILKNIYPSETEIWDDTMADPYIRKRMQNFTDSFNEIFKDDEVSLKHRIFNALVETNVVEGLNFYCSFVVSFSFAARGVMEGNGKIIKSIEKDESLHCAITTEVLRIFRDTPEEGFQHVYDPRKIQDCYRIAVDNEREWAAYLFSKGNLLGLTKEQFIAFAEFRANQRLAVLDIDPIYPKYKNNPLGSWYQEFIRPKSVQPAPQETELGAVYKIGARDANVDYAQFEDYDLG